VSGGTKDKEQIALNVLSDKLERIAQALEAGIHTPRNLSIDADVDAFVWHTDPDSLMPVTHVNRVGYHLLQGIDRVRDILLENTQRFARGYAANNALLWGARGMGKSSLVKAVHAKINDETPNSLILVEINREDIPSLPRLLHALRNHDRRVILYCDDLSFDHDDTSYKSLKAVLEGGLEGRPDNVVFYATSNRRHLMPRDMMENERSTAINPAEAVEEKVSLSDRFGLWLGFHSCSQEDYLAMIDGYVAEYSLTGDQADIRRAALEWSVTRGARSGRVAWQFIQDLAGRLGRAL
jgi:predicted AAA+ superfamily ATPase